MGFLPDIYPHKLMIKLNIRCTSDICKQMLTVASAAYTDTLYLRAHLGVCMAFFCRVYAIGYFTERP